MTKRPARVRLQQRRVLSSITNRTNAGGVDVDCFPLSAITAALGVSHVDYFSLDVEGPELDILRTIDWARLRIDVITIEYRIILSVGRRFRINKPETLKKLKDLRDFFRETGLYREMGVLPNGTDDGGLDVVFARI